MTIRDVPAHSVKKAALQEQLAGGKCRCMTCEHRFIITEGNAGRCKTRYNVDGELYTIVYGCAASVSCNPIEKKPLYHFYPGPNALTIGALGRLCPWRRSSMQKRLPLVQACATCTWETCQVAKMKTRHALDAG